jgi:hypothetical protein
MLQNMPISATLGQAKAESRIAEVMSRIDILQKKTVYLNELAARLGPFQRAEDPATRGGAVLTRAAQPHFYETLHAGLDVIESYIDSAVEAINRVEV